MSTLAHIFEAEGIATIALGSIKSQIESTAPPRGLWCDFPLGRPLRLNAARFSTSGTSSRIRPVGQPEPIFAEYDVAISDDGQVNLPVPPRRPDAHPQWTRPTG